MGTAAGALPAPCSDAFLSVVPVATGLQKPQPAKKGHAAAEAATNGNGADAQSRQLSEFLSRVEGSEEGTVFWAELCRGD
jgi:hypothetical protein